MTHPNALGTPTRSTTKSRGGNLSLRICDASEAVMSDEDDWDFAGADDAKIFAAGYYRRRPW
jgi:hypothetical protein